MSILQFHESSLKIELFSDRIQFGYETLGSKEENYNNAHRKPLSWQILFY